MMLSIFFYSIQLMDQMKWNKAGGEMQITGML